MWCSYRHLLLAGAQTAWRGSPNLTLLRTMVSIVQRQAAHCCITGPFGANSAVSFPPTHSGSRIVTNRSRSTDYGCSESAGARGPIFLSPKQTVYGPNLRAANILEDHNAIHNLGTRDRVITPTPGLCELPPVD